MKKATYYLITILIYTIPCGIFAQKIDHLASFRAIDSESYFRFNYDNDYFDSSDEFYTQGYNFEWVSPILKKNPLNKVLYGSSDESTKFGLSFEHIGFTPSDIVSKEIQFDDRPFSAALMLKSFSLVENKIKKTRIASQLNLGMMGPIAFGKEMQTGIHKAINGAIPGGWKNQIANDVVINYKLDFEKELLRLKNFLLVNANASLNIGTLFTNASIGFNSSLGLLQNIEKPQGMTFFIYGQPIVYMIGYDATLQGGLFNKNSPYTLSAQDIERIVLQFNWGVVMKLKKLYLEYSRTLITKEFSTGEFSGWGGIRIGFKLKVK